MRIVLLAAGCLVLSAVAAGQTLYWVGSASIPAPIANGGVTVTGVDIYTPYPPSASSSSWWHIVLAVTVSHPTALAFLVPPMCGSAPPSFTSFGYNVVNGSFD